MTCSIAWMDKETGAYGVIADRLCVGPPYSEATYRDKTTFVRALPYNNKSRGFCMLAFAGDTARMLFAQKYLENSCHRPMALETPLHVEDFLLSLHSELMSKGPATPTYPPESGNSGVQIALAHRTGVYKYEGVAIVHHKSPEKAHDRLLTVGVGSASEYVEGFFRAVNLYNIQADAPQTAYFALSQSCYRLPHAVSRSHTLIEFDGVGTVFSEDDQDAHVVLIENVQ